MAEEHLAQDEPCYVISVAAKLVSLHPQTLRYYDRLGLIQPSRTSGRIRLYSQRDIERLRKIARLTEHLGVNLAGVEVILNMSSRIEELQDTVERLKEEAEAEIRALRGQIRRLEQQQSDSRSEGQVINVSAREIKIDPKKEEPHDRG